MSAVASALAAFFAFRAVRQSNELRIGEARSAAYESIVVEPIEAALERFVREAEGEIFARQSSIAHILSGSMFTQSLVDKELQLLSDSYSKIWIELERVVRRSMIVWHDPTLRRELELGLEDLQDHVLVEISSLGAQPGFEFVPLIDRLCASLNRLLWSGHPTLKDLP